MNTLVYDIMNHLQGVVIDHVKDRLNGDWRGMLIFYDERTHRVGVSDKDLLSLRHSVVDSDEDDIAWDDGDTVDTSQGLSNLYKLSKKTLWCIFAALRDNIDKYPAYYKDIVTNDMKYNNFKAALFYRLTSVLFVGEPNHEKIIHRVIDRSFEKLKDKLK